MSLWPRSTPLRRAVLLGNVHGMPLPVPKTYKLFVAGKFPRSESGRSYQPAGDPQRNVARASRKDARDAVGAARAALPGWMRATAYLRGQILYRCAETIEARHASFVDELCAGGSSRSTARREVDAAIALTVWYAGMCDKVTTLLGSHNAVAGPFCSFSTVEPTGVVACVAPEHAPLVGLLALVLPVLAGGNTVVAVVSEPQPFAALALGEIAATSDVPAGVCNLLSGPRAELAAALAAHRDVDGLFVGGELRSEWAASAADSVKRVRHAPLPAGDVRHPERLRGLAWVEPFVEVKTLWHPVAP